MPHRPKFMVSKNEATRKLMNAIKRGNVESVKRQLNRGANVTAKNVTYNSRLDTNNEKNVYNLVENNRILKQKQNTKQNILNLLESKGFNVKGRKQANNELRRLEKESQDRHKEENRRLRESWRQQKLERMQRRKLINNYHTYKEQLRPIVFARKRLSNLNAAMTYKNGKPEGLRIKIPKNRTRKVHYESNTLPVK